MGTPPPPSPSPPPRSPVAPFLFRAASLCYSILNYLFSSRDFFSWFVSRRVSGVCCALCCVVLCAVFLVVFPYYVIAIVHRFSVVTIVAPILFKRKSKARWKKMETSWGNFSIVCVFGCYGARSWCLEPCALCVQYFV